ncbi:MAG: flagellar basal body-associated FliL family protein [Gemmatimonadetes bacterium]|nr:flagellar basal body-associated FliL family protein [Gemmatimonadota bacterium]
MSNDSNDTNDSPEPELDAPAAKTKRLPLVIALTVGLTVGALAGSLVVGPLVAEGDPAAKCACEAEGAEKAGEHGAAVDSHGNPVAKPTYTVENLVLNPAQSGGSRFLVLSISFSVKDSATVSKMTGRDAELRDIILKVLGSKTVPQLTDMAARPAIKAEVRAHAGRLFGEKTITDVFFPQWVIQ